MAEDSAGKEEGQERCGTMMTESDKSDHGAECWAICLHNSGRGACCDVR